MGRNVYTQVCELTQDPSSLDPCPWGRRKEGSNEGMGRKAPEPPLVTFRKCGEGGNGCLGAPLVQTDCPHLSPSRLGWVSFQVCGIRPVGPCLVPVRPGGLRVQSPFRPGEEGSEPHSQAQGPISPPPALNTGVMSFPPCAEKVYVMTLWPKLPPDTRLLPQPPLAHFLLTRGPGPCSALQVDGCQCPRQNGI